MGRGFWGECHSVHKGSLGLVEREGTCRTGQEGQGREHLVAAAGL